ncbi:UPF0715 family protein [Bacillus subtilis]
MTLSKKTRERLRLIKGLILAVVFSSLSLGFIQYLISGAYSAYFLILVLPFYFLIPYLIFALPLQYLLNKYHPRRFSVVYFLLYLILSLVANFLIFYSHSVPGYPPVLARPEIYFYTFATAIVYWFWDSIFSQRVNTSQTK